MSSIADESLLQDFLAEGREHLSSIEPDLLDMESHGSDVDSETVNRVFRAIHSIKGAAGFFGFENLKELSHVMESVLMKIRDGERSPTPEIMDTLLAGVDLLCAMFDDIHASDGIPSKEAIARCGAILSSEGAEGAGPGGLVTAICDSSSSPVEFAASRDQIQQARKHGQTVFTLRVFLHRDLEGKGRSPLEFLSLLESMGTVLDSRMDTSSIGGLDECLEGDLLWVLLYATVLEKGLLTAALDMLEEQVEVAAIHEGPLQHAEERVGAPAETPQSSDTVEATSAAKEEKEMPAGVPDAAGTAETIRVRVDILNQIMNQAGELVLARNQLLRSLENTKLGIQGLPGILQNLDLVTSSLQAGIMQTRMQPIGNVFAKVPRLIRDTSRKMGKEIELEMSGTDVELDKSMLELLSDPLTHIVRNCCDHGIESPDERERSGKPRCGKVILSAFHESGQVNVLIEDDGRGIDAERVVEKAVASGALTRENAERLSPQERLHLIFLPGLSTAEKVSEVSGRGVGMDVVRANIERLGGNVELESALGEGTKTLIRLPLTLAIIPSLIVRISQHRFAVPQVNIVELVCVRAAEVSKRIERVGEADVLRLRGRLLPIVRLADVLGIQRQYCDPKTESVEDDRRESLVDRRSLSEPDEMEVERRGSREDRRKSWRNDLNVVVLRVGSNQFGIIVDELFDVEEIVVKPLSAYTQECKCFSGATIMGDGRVAMILDAGGIAAQARLSFADTDAENRRREQERLRAAASAGERRSVLLFKSHPEEVFAIPLGSITRLESFDTSQIELVGSREFVNLRGDAVPLIRMENHLPVRPFPQDLRDAYLIIPKESHGGILASAIVDALETDATLRGEGIRGPGVLGSAILNDRMTLFLEPRELLSNIAQ